MAAAAELLRDFRHVHRALAADAHPDALMRHFTKEDRYFNAGNAKCIVDQAFTIFVERANRSISCLVTDIHVTAPSRCRVESAAPSRHILDIGAEK